METKWRFERVVSHKLQGYVWVVSNPEGRRGYFKFATEDQWHYSGPLIANEFIASHLATHLGFPVGELQEAVVPGPDGVHQHGVVSVVVPAQDVTTWGGAPSEVVQHPERFVYDVPLLSTLVVFDAWTANIDRATGKNIVLYRDHLSQKYRWYLIDHALAMYGAPCKWKDKPWDSRYWEQIWKYHHVPKGLLKLQSTKQTLEPMIERIESLPNTVISDALSQVSRELLDDPGRVFTQRLLLQRRKRLRKMLNEWLEYHGTKEYRR